MSRACLAQVFLTQTHLAIAMEYAQGGDLFNYTLGHRPHGRLAEQQARWIFQQLIIGLDYCHRRVRAAACHAWASSFFKGRQGERVPHALREGRGLHRYLVGSTLPPADSRPHKAAVLVCES